MVVVEYQEGIHTRFPRRVPASIGLIIVGLVGLAVASRNDWLARPFALALVLGVVGLLLQFAARYKRILLTKDRLKVGRDSFPLAALDGPVITGEAAVQLAGSIASNPMAAKENAHLRLLGGSAATTLGQKPVLVRHRKSKKLLVIGSWQPDVLAAALERAMAQSESLDWGD